MASQKHYRDKTPDIRTAAWYGGNQHLQLLKLTLFSNGYGFKS
jgi:hypothetical protein